MSGISQNNIRERFNEFLVASGLKLTSERLIILNEALATEGHFEADDLLAILKQKSRKTSRATVYRTLEILAQSGVLRKVCFDGSAAHFEKITGLPRHEHLICRKCGTRYEITVPELSAIQNRLGQEYNFVVRDYSFHIYGLCKNCTKDMK